MVFSSGPLHKPRGPLDLTPLGGSELAHVRVGLCNTYQFLTDSGLRPTSRNGSARWATLAGDGYTIAGSRSTQPAIQFGRQIEYRFGVPHNRLYRITLLGPVR